MNVNKATIGALALLLVIGLVVATNVSKKGENQAADARCSLVQDSGPCKAYVAKYYFDAKIGKCQEFGWGGCKGTGTVPFDNLEECKSVCEK